MTDARKKELFEQLKNVDDKLSPENLCCDGEAPRSWVIREGNRLNRIRDKIIRELGYEPDLFELYPEFRRRSPNTTLTTPPI
jgi:hypothetical protein